VDHNNCGWVNWFRHHVGKVVEVTEFSPSGNIGAKELGKYYWSKNYVEVLSTSYPNPPHKHAEIIKAWADGATIQINEDHMWFDYCPYVDGEVFGVFSTDFEFRIKPQKTEREIEIERIESEMRKLADSLKELKNADD
jgi:hypothetical protein